MYYFYALRLTVWIDYMFFQVVYNYMMIHIFLLNISCFYFIFFVDKRWRLPICVAFSNVHHVLWLK